MKKMISASIALFVMEEPQVGPTLVTLILSWGVVGAVLVGDVVVVVDADVAAAPALAVVVVVGLAVVVVVGLAVVVVGGFAVVVVVGLAVVVVVVGVAGACVAVTARSAFSTLLPMAACWSCDSLFRSDC